MSSFSAMPLVPGASLEASWCSLRFWASIVGRIDQRSGQVGTPSRPLPPALAQCIPNKLLKSIHTVYLVLNRFKLRENAVLPVRVRSILAHNLDWRCSVFPRCVGPRVLRPTLYRKASRDASGRCTPHDIFRSCFSVVGTLGACGVGETRVLAPSSFHPQT